ncbi:hypothetical protein C7M84_018450 [Penaeus vannamei]|uniref:EGF-like domain-containing protein n=1 Tax=Penaeus vannamei TaxID=6689 RepID=A0A423SHL7_PENVA|nr:hypothetical protein C7M84_018450 [Penaeus vannamei]
MEVINSCLENNGGCEHMCRHAAGGAECSCHAGYLLQPDLRSCQDDNECETGSHRCEQECVNTAGGYVCACRQGFTLSADGFSCEDVNECAQENGGCEHECRNSQGSFACSCRPGYLLVDLTHCDSKCGTRSRSFVFTTSSLRFIIFFCYSCSLPSVSDSHSHSAWLC